jgi:hypothetical protein
MGHNDWSYARRPSDDVMSDATSDVTLTLTTPEACSDVLSHTYCP